MVNLWKTSEGRTDQVAAYHRWQRKHSGLQVGGIKLLRVFQAENAKLE